MDLSEKNRNPFKNIIQTICISIGGFYLFIGTAAILMVQLQRWVLDNFDTQDIEEFANSLLVQGSIWNFYMPLLMILGIIYILFGLVLKKIPKYRFTFNLILSLASLAWFIGYTIDGFIFFKDYMLGFEPDANIALLFAIAGTVFLFALFTVPQFMIGWYMKKQVTRFNL